MSSSFIKIKLPSNWKPLLASLILCFLLTNPLSLWSQQTTFKTNGPDDYREGLYAFTKVTLYQDYKTIRSNATVVIKNGKIIDVNTTGVIPAGATVYYMQGKFLYPSFIDLYSDYGMTKIKKIQEMKVSSMNPTSKVLMVGIKLFIQILKHIKHGHETILQLKSIASRALAH